SPNRQPRQAYRCNRRQRSRKDNGPEPVATIPQCRCQRQGDLQWRSKRKRPRLREAPLDESQTCSVRKSHAIAASSSQRSFGKTFLKAFECAKTDRKSTRLNSSHDQ